jgi:Tfp pilus assembly protein PilO
MNKIILIPVFLIITIALVFGLVSPRYKDYNEKMAQVKSKEAELQAVKDYYAAVDKTSKELAKYTGEMARINLALPNETSDIAISDYFQKKSSESGLVLEDSILPVTIAQSSLNPLLKENNVSLSLSGSYSALKNFLYGIEESARMPEVDKISFSAGEKESSLSINLSLKLYSY